MKQSIIIFMNITLLSAILCSCGKNDFSVSEEYLYNLTTFTNAIEVSTSTCKNECSMVERVWFDSIFSEANTDTIQYTYDSEKKETRDFDDAIALYKKSDGSKDAISSIDYDSKLLSELYGILQNPSDKYSSQFDDAKELYETYLKLYSLSCKPTGTYTDYYESINELTSSLEAKNVKLLDSLPSFDTSSYDVKDKEMYICFSYGLRKGVYSGNIESGVQNGNATFTSESSDNTEWTYTGNFSSGHFDGKGTSSFSTGSSYSGEYSNDLENGKGTYIDSNGKKITGTFKDGSVISED